ncbi:MAG: hypothetical protein WAT92_13690 [Saprospiraceae bacterium]
MMENIRLAQKNMNDAYSGGFAGVIVSGFIWLLAGLCAIYFTEEKAIWFLFFGGMLIHPLSILFNKLLGTSGKHDDTNPLGKLAMEGTVFMIVCIAMALVLSFQKTEWFFQAMMLIIGSRYLTFQTLYGNKVYWVVGILLVMAGFSSFFLQLPATISIFIGASIELIIGIYFLRSFRSKTKVSFY